MESSSPAPSMTSGIPTDVQAEDKIIAREHCQAHDVAVYPRGVRGDKVRHK